MCVVVMAGERGAEALGDQRRVVEEDIGDVAFFSECFEDRPHRVTVVGSGADGRPLGGIAIEPRRTNVDLHTCLVAVVVRLE